MSKVEFIRINNAKEPTKGTKHAAGWDIYSNEELPVVVGPHDRVMIDTGIRVAIPHGFYLKVESKSGMTWKLKTSVPTGVIDSDYRDRTIKVILHNTSNINTITINRYDPLAQLILHRHYPEIEFSEVETFSDDTKYNHEGFGSTSS
jgi:dUTP pyrophosphatase